MDSATLRRDAWRSNRPAGSVDRLDVASGWAVGMSAADSAIDSGAGVLLLLDNSAPSAHACALTALYANTDATAVVTDAATDLEWMRRCAEIRDAMASMRPLVGDAAALLAHDSTLAYWAAVISQAASRRTPVVLAGALPHIAALVAQRLTSSSTAWVFSGIGDASTTTGLALKRLTLTPWASIAWLPEAEQIESIVRALVDDLD